MNLWGSRIVLWAEQLGQSCAMEKTRLIISDENRLFREGLSKILAGRTVTVAGEFSSLVEAEESFISDGYQSDLMVCDPAPNFTQEFDAMKKISRRFPEIRILVLTEELNSSYLALAVESGASGFLSKDISAAALHISLELILLGENIFPSHISLPWETPSFQAPAPAQPPQAPLSMRERQILCRLVQGMPNKTIARDLQIAEATVKVHLKALLRKINAENRTQAAIWGMNHPCLSEGLES